MDPLNFRNFSFHRSPAPADNTIVARPLVLKDENASKKAVPMSETQQRIAEVLEKNPRRQCYISEARPVPESVRKAQAVERRRQENLNKMYQMDPFAAQVNGFRNFGTTTMPQVSKVGPTVLEGVALLHPVGNLSLGTLNTTKQVMKTAKDPSALNIGLSLLEVAGTASGAATQVKGALAAGKPIHFLAHNKWMHGAHQIHEVVTVASGLKTVSGISSSPDVSESVLDPGPTVRNSQLKEQIGDSLWNKLWIK